jgi:iron(II)-dependent oxidoreductase
VYADLPPEYWLCYRFPYLDIVNPPLWEWAHVAWFQEYWCHRHDFSLDQPTRAAALPGADDWVDSRRVPHKVRWLPGHPVREDVESYMTESLERSLSALRTCPAEQRYPFRLALYHETMHVEALLMTLRTLGLPMPRAFVEQADAVRGHGIAAAVAQEERTVTRAVHDFGSPPEAEHFVFDNERGAFKRELPDFNIATLPVSRAAFREFVAEAYWSDGIWTESGLAWRATRPARRENWLTALESNLQHPVEGVSAHETEAFCRHAGRRLPTEFEWEAAARQGAIAGTGVVWEWTSSDFLPYRGFTADPYREYSQPWFGDHRVLKGGSWATHPDLKRPAFRNFYLPGRADVFAGFRTCAV